MRVAVVGNSHLAAYRLAWDTMAAGYRDLDLVFFGSPATSIRSLKVEGGALHPTTDALRANFAWTSRGLDHIGGDYDAYILVGMGFSFAHLMALLRNHVPPWARDASTAGRHLVSAEAFADFMAATLRNSNALNLVDKLGQVTSAPVVYAPNPFPAIGITGHAAHSDYGNQPLVDRVFEFYRSELPRVPQRGCLLFEQPEATLAAPMFTRDMYTRGSVKLKEGLKHAHRDDDMFHMNAEFGRVMLSGILQRFPGVEAG